VTEPRTLVLGLGEWHASRDSELTLVCLGLGSCVGLCLFDPAAGVAGMAHMVLPKSMGEAASGKAAKFVDLAVPL
jgi:chemotaxis protein CheD